MSDLELRREEATARGSVVLGAPAGDPLMAAIGRALSGADIAAVVVPLDPTLRDDAEHEARFRAALDAAPRPWVIGGFSVGARIAARLCPELVPMGLLCFGYPFHSPGEPSARNGLETLLQVRVPTRIVQGARDPHGTEADVRGYQLPDHIEMVWLRDGNHRFVPRERSGLTHEAHLAAAAAAAISFVRAR